MEGTRRGALAGLGLEASRRSVLRSLAGSALGLAATRWGGAREERDSVAAAQEDAARPNILFILTDDMRADDLAFMPHVQSLLVEQGATFTTFAATSPGCAPARASILRGQYPHNHGLLRGSGEFGGADVFQRLGNEESSIATWLQDAGYRTALIGKYINGYGSTEELVHIPPGWSEWAGVTSEGYTRFSINENGTVQRYREKKDVQPYLTDVLADMASTVIAETVPTGQPFFIHLSPRAPHGPAEPAPRHLEAFEDATVPRSEALNEADVSDKANWVRILPEMDADQIAEVDAYYRARLQTLLAVDELVASLIATLEATGALENTFIVFSSDNGYGLGEHRIVQDKGSPYEEAILVPMVMRGPGIPAGLTVDALASQVDLAPTFAAWAGAATPDFLDGRSLAPLASGEPVPTDWRQTMLVEQFANNPARTDKQPAFEALRAKDFVFVAYGTGEQELYDLQADPAQLNNLAASADPAVLAALSERAERMKICAGATCREIESEPLLTASATPAASS